MGAYVASKAAIHGLTMTAAKDLAPHQIRVNSISPALIGPSDGFMWKRQNELHASSGSPYFDRDPDVVGKKKIAGVPLKRLGEVQEVSLSPPPPTRTASTHPRLIPIFDLAFVASCGYRWSTPLLSFLVKTRHISQELISSWLGVWLEAFMCWTGRPGNRELCCNFMRGTRRPVEFPCAVS